MTKILGGDSHSLFPLIKDKNSLSPYFLISKSQSGRITATLHMYDTFTILKIYIPCESQFEPGEIFLKKKTTTWIIPYIRGKQGIFGWKDEENIRFNGKGNVQNWILTIEKWIKMEKKS